MKRLSLQDTTRLALGVETAVVLEHELRQLEADLESARVLLRRLAVMPGATQRRTPTLDALRQDARAFLLRSREPVEA
jgi:hypothetical protein